MARVPPDNRPPVTNEDGSLFFGPPVKTGRLSELDGYLIPSRFYIDVWSEGLPDEPIGRIHFKVTDGTIVPTEVSFRSQLPWFELHDYSLNDLPLKSLALAALHQLTEGQERNAPPPIERISRKGAQMRAVLEVLKEIELLDVAIAYCHEPSKGTQLAMDQMGYNSRSTTSSKVRQAREKGLIPPPGSKPADYEKALRELKRKRANYEAQN